MKRLLLPKNKFVRLIINIAFIPTCWHITFHLYFLIGDWSSSVYKFIDDYRIGWYPTVFLLINLIPDLLITKIIWNIRIKPRLKITRSKD